MLCLQLPQETMPETDQLLSKEHWTRKGHTCMLPGWVSEFGEAEFQGILWVE